MEWTESIRAAVAYLEAHIREEIDPEDVARAAGVSPFYLQRGFEILTGFSMGRYLRSRRLYLAALDLAAGKGKVIDVALRYGFETPEGFTKAFTRFHGATPTQVVRDHSRIKTFFPLKIVISIQGGNSMEYTVEKQEAFTLIGFAREIAFDDGYEDCPAFWEEFIPKYLTPLFQGKEPETPQEQAVCRHGVGEFGVCLDGGSGESFRYLIAGTYRGGPVPQGMELVEFPAMEWAKFPCRGPMAGALQSVNTQIFREWLPGNPEFEMAMAANLEWYAPGGTDDTDYESAIWLPVKRKGAALQASRSQPER